MRREAAKLTKIRAGLYRHPSGKYVILTEGWGPSERRRYWEIAKDDTFGGGLVIVDGLYGTRREAVAALEATQ